MEMELSLSGAGIAAVVALGLSLLLSYVPQFAAFWEQVPAEAKRGYLAWVGLGVACVLAGLHYAGAVDLGLGAFGWPVVWQVLQAWLAFAGAGQLAYTGAQAVEERQRVKLLLE